uniref:Uncharacterized protein n=1 Tax=Arundo donax TaxID=35708 RepID=A0A0A8Z6J5_ARUDO
MLCLCVCYTHMGCLIFTCKWKNATKQKTWHIDMRVKQKIEKIL